jgi:signal transduction histidine kinase
MAKSQFLAMMSHEILTPLNAVIGFSEMMQDDVAGPLNERQHQFTGHIVDSSRHLLGLVNNILDLSRIESGRMEFTPSRIDLSRLVETSVLMVKETAIKSNVSLVVKISEDLADAWINADELRLKQIFLNLLSNAGKFTPDGGKIELWACKQGDDLMIRCSDTGIGILPNDQDRIFKAFEQGERSYSRPYGGAGLGLALTKKLVDLHGGRIWVESEGQGKGSTFSITIPLN